MAARGLTCGWIFVLCIASFCTGMLFTNKMWLLPESSGLIRPHGRHNSQGQVASELCDTNFKAGLLGETGMFFEDVSETRQTVRTLDSSMSEAEMELLASRGAEGMEPGSSPTQDIPNLNGASDKRPKVFFVIGINTAFSSRKRRDSVRMTWMPRGEKLKKLEKEKGIVVRFVIGHGATPGGILDRAIEAEDSQHHDFLRLQHIEGYHELSAKTKIYFATAVSIWDAEFYIKVDDDVHVNLGALGTTLAKRRTKRRIYVGCMKSGPVLAQKGVRYHEPEYWKFGEQGNKYFRHATGQIYAISRDLAVYISKNLGILHKYANEDVSIGAWFIGLDVEHIDDRKMCCGTPDCEWKLQSGNACVASFDWTCSGICRPVDRLKSVHRRCGEGERALWGAVF